MALFVLWLFCVIELLQRKQEFLQKIVENASHLSSIDQQADIYKTGIWLTIMLLFGLGLVIVLGFWFLNIVVLTYLHLKRCQQQWDVNQIEAEKALLAPHEQSHDPNNKNRLK
uniref:Uncharacterized protein n=1 Tax=Ditylenchus dipsaci TaxID=166011 RepID=A0A915DBX0_9BILA